MRWLDQIDANADCWQDFVPYLEQLPDGHFPACEQLNSLLPDGLFSAGGARICFVDSNSHSDGDYEHRIYTSGQISTRPGSWHDLFNALAWMRFPRIKSAINTLHFHAEAATQGRGRARDALTLFDECGVILASDNADLLLAIARRDWCSAFQKKPDLWQTDIAITTFGHAMLEKYLTPYKSMTANALLIQTDINPNQFPRDEFLTLLDSTLAEKLLETRVKKGPAMLAPLPLAGVPGWTFFGPQTNSFYADRTVFRPAPDDLTAAPILQLELG